MFAQRLSFITLMHMILLKETLISLILRHSKRVYLKINLFLNIWSNVLFFNIDLCRYRFYIIVIGVSDNIAAVTERSAKKTNSFHIWRFHNCFPTSEIMWLYLW